MKKIAIYGTGRVAEYFMNNLQGFNMELWLLRYKYIFSKLYVI